MTSPVPVLATVSIGGPAASTRPLLVLGPSLGTTVADLWGRCSQSLDEQFEVLGWDLPGHGGSAPAQDLSLASLAQGVLDAVEPVLAERGDPGGSFCYAGDSIGGAVGLALLLDHPTRVRAATLVCTGARIGTPQLWDERAELVGREGVEAVVAGSRQRWFAPGFAEDRPEVAEPLLTGLRAVDGSSYVALCEALRDFDVRDRLAEITRPVLAVAGGHDTSTPTASLVAIAEGVQHGAVVVLADVAHLAPAEAPEAVARLISGQGARSDRTQDVAAAGLAVRRAVLGVAHVDRATASTTDLTREFQDLITRYAWGEIWTRPGLDRRSRSLITLTALVAGGHHEELVLHLRAARTNGVTMAEITELLLQTAIYCGVPAANTAFRIAQETFAADGADATTYGTTDGAGSS